jgi:Flp pilus assembly protein TadD
MTRKVVLAVLLLEVFAAAVFGQIRQPVIQDYSISGRIVFGMTNPPEERIEVRLVGLGAQVLATAFSDIGGNFEFRNLQPGAYIIHIDFPGFEEVREPVEVRNLGGRNANVSILMNRILDVRRQEGPDGLPTDDPDVIDVSEMQTTYPKKAIDEYKRALEDSRKGDTEKAMKRLQEALKLAPDFYHAHNNLGVIYQRRGQYREAENEYRTARELSPTSQQPLVNLGSLFIQEADSRQADGRRVVGQLLDDAMDLLDEAIRMRPLSGIAHYYLGAANYKSSFYEEAEASLKRAHELEPGMSMVRLMLANVFMKQNRWDEVLSELDAYLKESPKASDRAAIEQMRAKIAEGLETQAR